MGEIKSPIIPLEEKIAELVPAAVSLGVGNLGVYQENNVALHIAKATAEYSVNAQKINEQRKFNEIQNSWSILDQEFRSTYQSNVDVDYQDPEHQKKMLEAYNEMTLEKNSSISNAELSSDYTLSLEQDLKTAVGNDLFNLQSNFNKINNKLEIDETMLTIQQIDSIILSFDPRWDGARINQATKRKNDLIRELGSYGISEPEQDTMILERAITNNVKLLEKELKTIITDPENNIEDQEELLESFSNQVKSKEFRETFVDNLVADNGLDQNFVEGYFKTNMEDFKFQVDSVLKQKQKEIRDAKFVEDQNKINNQIKIVNETNQLMDNLNFKLNTGNTLSIASAVYDEEVTALDFARDQEMQIDLFKVIMKQANKNNKFMKMFTNSSRKNIETIFQENTNTTDRFTALKRLNLDLEGLTPNNTQGVINSKLELVGYGVVNQVEQILFERSLGLEDPQDVSNYRDVINSAPKGDVFAYRMSWVGIDDAATTFTGNYRKSAIMKSVIKTLTTAEYSYFNRVVSGMVISNKFEGFPRGAAISGESISTMVNTSKSDNDFESIMEVLSIISTVKTHALSEQPLDVDNARKKGLESFNNKLKERNMQIQDVVTETGTQYNVIDTSPDL